MRARVFASAAAGLVLLLASCGRATPQSTSPSASPSHGAALAAVSPTFQTAEVGVTYTPFTMGAAGGKPPYAWEVGSGALPDGLTLASDGAFSGTPTAAGTFSFTLVVTDTKSARASLDLSMTVSPGLSAGLVKAGTIVVEQGQSAGAFASQSGGVAPYTYAVGSGSLPAGTSLNGVALAGTFSETGTYNFTVTVTDSMGATATVSPTYYVFGPIAFPPAAAGVEDAYCSGVTSAGCTTQLAYSGGTPGTTPILTWRAANVYPPHGTVLTPVDLGVELDGQAVRVTYSGENRMMNWRPWDGYAAIILSDPVTHESTREALVRLNVTGG